MPPGSLGSRDPASRPSTLGCSVTLGFRARDGSESAALLCASSYRTVVRPIYRVTYKTLTALEWRCCPGHAGANCEEGENRHRLWEGGLILPWRWASGPLHSRGGVVSPRGCAWAVAPPGISVSAG